jgi:putative DNA primase/helicase
VHAIVTREARRFPGVKILMVAQKGAKEGLIDLGLPPNVETGHHNAVAGQDIWRDVQLLVVIGRTMPRTAAVERMAEALTGSAIAPLAGQYERITGARFVAGRGLVACEVDRHPDPVAEAIRRQVCEGELVQIVGRGRGVNRTAANPLDVLVMTDVALPMPAHEEIAAADLDPTLPDLMLAAGGIAFENPGHAAEACPQIWSNREAAKKAFARARLGTFWYEEYSHTGLSPTSGQIQRIHYQRAGSGHSPAIAWFDPVLCPAPETFLTDKLGPLAWCRLQPAEPDPSPEPPAPQTPEPTMEAPDALPAARIPLLPPDWVFPPMRASSPIVPIEGLWRVSSRSGAPRVVEERPRGFTAPRHYPAAPEPKFTPFSEILAMARHDAMLERSC